jgi:leucyl-tRNA synthetase
MPQWAGSSWYFIRYCDPHNKNAIASPEALKYWLSVDWYNGGMEHTTLHLLYSRFWHKALYDMGVVPTEEPYQKRTSHGMILGENGEKMSKSRGNVINPDDIVGEYGADTMRLYEMFLGDFEKSAPWSSTSIKGCRRFLDRIWALQEHIAPQEGLSPELEASFNKCIKKVSDDIENLKFNTAIAAMMSLLNEIADKGSITKGEFKLFLLMLNPFAPHITEEIWSLQNYGGMVTGQKWPDYDESKCKVDAVEIAVQVSGKLRGVVMLPVEATQDEAFAAASSLEKVSGLLQDKKIVKIIHVKGKLINIVVK